MEQENAYLGLEDILALHADMMERMGSSPAPLRDVGALESAIAKPQNAAHYEGADLVRQAALLAVGISQAQAFIDGNKRTGYLAALVFLRINHHPLRGDLLEFARQLEAVAERTDSLEAATARLEAWLRERVE